ncbi:MAG: hypothetical protein ACI8RD_005691 [Bacillariaceae sp.]|jgi:hypothetical protein
MKFSAAFLLLLARYASASAGKPELSVSTYHLLLNVLRVVLIVDLPIAKVIVFPFFALSLSVSKKRLIVFFIFLI